MSGAAKRVSQARLSGSGRIASLERPARLVLLGTAWCGVSAVATVTTMAIVTSSAERSLSWWWTLLALSAVCAFGVAALAYALRGVVTDVDVVARRVRAMARRARFDEPLVVRSLDEVLLVTRAVDALRERYLESLERDRVARSEAERADRYKSEFLATVRRELSTPLNSIIGITESLLSDPAESLDEDSKENAELIHASSRHLRELFEEILDLSAATSGQLALRVEPTDVGALVLELTRVLEGQRRGRALDVRANVPSAPVIARVDPVRLRQILMNLGTNALKFTERGGVTFEVREESGIIEVRVSDTGAGIAADELHAIFDEYKQVGDVRKRTRGAGLGLAICKKLCELHGGSVGVTSTLGVGTVFTVRLPVGGPR